MHTHIHSHTYTQIYTKAHTICILNALPQAKLFQKQSVTCAFTKPHNSRIHKYIHGKIHTLLTHHILTAYCCYPFQFSADQFISLTRVMQSSSHLIGQFISQSFCFLNEHFSIAAFSITYNKYSHSGGASTL